MNIRYALHATFVQEERRAKRRARRAEKRARRARRRRRKVCVSQVTFKLFDFQAVRLYALLRRGFWSITRARCLS